VHHPKRDNVCNANAMSSPNSGGGGGGGGGV